MKVKSPYQKNHILNEAKRSVLGTSLRTLRLGLFALVFIGFSDILYAQSGENGQVYKLQIEGIVERSEAKAVLSKFNDLPLIESSTFIMDCTCFKVRTSIEVDYKLLQEFLIGSNFEIKGSVLTSDGRELIAPVKSESDDE